MDKASLVRLLVLLISLVNIVLSNLGIPLIPEVLGDLTAELIIIVAALIAAWKNNYLSRKGKAQKEVLEKNGLK